MVWRLGVAMSVGMGETLASGGFGTDMAALRAAIGMGAAIVLFGVSVWTPAPLFPIGVAVGSVEAGYLASSVNVAMLAVAAAVSLFLAGRRARCSIPAPRIVAILVSVLACACACLWVATFLAVPGSESDAANGAGQFDGSCFTALLGWSGVVSGTVVALVVVWWLCVLRMLPAQQQRRALVVAALLSAVINLFDGFFGFVFARLAVIVLLLAEAVLAHVAARHMSSTPDGWAGNPAGPGTLRSAMGDLVPVTVAAAVVNLVAPLVNTVLMVDVLDLKVRLAISAAMNLLTAVLLAFVWFVPRRPPSVFSLLMGFSIVLFLGIVVSVPVGSWANVTVLSLGSAGFFLVFLLLVDAALEVSREHGCPCAAAYGFAAGIAMLARIAADLFSESLLNAGIADESKVLVAAFLLVYLLTCALFFLYSAIARRRRMEGSASIGASGQNLSPGAGDGFRSTWEQLACGCERVSDEFGLSAREREVLELMMRGRDVPMIAEELVLSRNTVQTHVRHVYAQLGIHSRKELVALVESRSA